jgi:hypothetical protein
MNTTKLMAAIAVTTFVAQSGVAAVLPSTAHLSPTAASLLCAGARVGTATKSKRSDIAQSGAIAIGVLAAAGAGVGIAAAAGAFDNGHKSTSP